MFDFSLTGVEEPIECADGQAYVLDPFMACEEEAQENNAYEEPPFYLGDCGVMGYLVKVENDKICMQSAIFFLGDCAFAPSIDVCEDAYVFDKPMLNFTKQFEK